MGDPDTDPGPRIPTILVVLAHAVTQDPHDSGAALALAEKVLEASEQTTTAVRGAGT